MRKLDEILKQNGFGNVSSEPAKPPEVPFPPSNEDREDPACDKCGGARFVRRVLPIDHVDFGRAFPCDCVEEEQADERQARLQRYSNLGPLVRLTFANLIPRGRSSSPADQQSFSHAVVAARDFARRPEGWLVFSGPSGAGKTHIAAAIANQSIALGRPALFVVVPDLLDHLRSTYGKESDITYDQLFEQVRNAPILILDDLGTQNMTAWTQEKLFQLINHRFNTQLPTIFTTNLAPNELPERMRTRLTDTALSRVFELESSQRLEYDELGRTIDLPGLKMMTFQRFDPRGLGFSTIDETLLREAHRQALAFAENPKDWLVFVGEHGTGKTHLAAAITHDRLKMGDTALFLVVPDLLEKIRRSMNPDAEGGNGGFFDLVRTVPVLVLDDLGAESQTPWVDEKLYQLINYRYNARLPTVITARSVEARDVGKRINSRLTDPAVSTVFSTTGGTGARPFDPSERPRRGRPRKDITSR